MDVRENVPLVATKHCFAVYPAVLAIMSLFQER